MSKGVLKKLITVSSSKSMFWSGAFILEYANEIVVISSFKPEMAHYTITNYVERVEFLFRCDPHRCI